MKKSSDHAHIIWPKRSVGLDPAISTVKSNRTVKTITPYTISSMRALCHWRSLESVYHECHQSRSTIWKDHWKSHRNCDLFQWSLEGSDKLWIKTQVIIIFELKFTGKLSSQKFFQQIFQQDWLRWIYSLPSSMPLTVSPPQPLVSARWPPS